MRRWRRRDPIGGSASVQTEENRRALRAGKEKRANSPRLWAARSVDPVQSLAAAEGLATDSRETVTAALLWIAIELLVGLSAGIALGRFAIRKLIAADMAFHDFIYALSGNTLVGPAMQTHWTHTQRVMGEVLMRDDKPRDIWDQHEALLAAVAAGDAEGAERLARQHILEAARFMIERMRGERSA